jgi:hypothetical protein
MATPGVSVQLNVASEITRVTALMQSTPEQITKAANRAIKKTVRWLQSRVAREISQSLNLSQKAFKHRLTTSSSGSGINQVHIVWLGVAPLAAEAAGKPRQTRAGVTVGKRKYQGAFYRDVYGDGASVWIRKRRAADLGLNLPSWSGKSTARRSTWLDDSQNSGRFPVMRVAIDIEEVASEIFRRYQRRINERFGQVLAQELNFVLNHEGR